MKQKSSRLEPWSATHRDIYEDGTVIYFRGPIEFLPNRIQFFPNPKPCPGANPHHHSNVEMIYVSRGEMTALAEDKSIPLSAGDLVIFNANSVHGTLIEHPVDYLCIILDPHYAAEYGITIADITFQNAVKQNKKIMELCDQMVQEVTEKPKLYALSANSLLHSLMVLLIRSFVQDSCLPETSLSGTQEYLVKKIVEYCQKNFRKKCTLADLEQHLGYSKEHMARTFKKAYEITILDHINILRCNYANNLLTNPNLRIQEIAQEVGFEEASYFAKIYKTYTGISPSEYRRKIKNASKE